MQYQVRAIKKVGVANYENDLNNVINAMAADDWTVQQLLGSPDQGFVILFAREI